ncbi:hypothetical protein G7Y89_g1315 [Cudoniella acicularis]|uniref:Uncharacterized protein n=1 Tax=Cudoniella acicularis TaxID=354080 RepID=A0A8H4W810_9HELO|nr:hypothetical protein G7Y89_g1315 [Cudoniella acicularis]
MADSNQQWDTNSVLEWKPNPGLPDAERWGLETSEEGIDSHVPTDLSLVTSCEDASELNKLQNITLLIDFYEYGDNEDFIYNPDDWLLTTEAMFLLQNGTFSTNRRNLPVLASEECVIEPLSKQTKATKKFDPPELRLKIWKLALPDPRKMQLQISTHLQTPTLKFWNGGYRRESDEWRFILTCRGSYDAFLQECKPLTITLQFDPKYLDENVPSKLPLRRSIATALENSECRLDLSRFYHIAFQYTGHTGDTPITTILNIASSAPQLRTLSTVLGYYEFRQRKKYLSTVLINLIPINPKYYNVAFYLSKAGEPEDKAILYLPEVNLEILAYSDGTPMTPLMDFESLKELFGDEDLRDMGDQQGSFSDWALP